jgi:lipopolysaccharide transport system permease protein
VPVVETEISQRNSAEFIQVSSPESPLASPGHFLRNALKDLVKSAYGAYRIFKQNIAHRYRHSSLGLFWALVPSAVVLLTMAVAQKAGGATFPTTGNPQVYAIFGLVMIQTFIEALNTQRALFASNRHLIHRQRYLIESLLLAGLAENAFSLAIKLPMLYAVSVFFGVIPGLSSIIGIVGFAIILLLGTTIGLLVAPLNALDQDVEHFLSFAPVALFASTPVLFHPRSTSWLHWLYQFNPLTPIFNTTRAITYGGTDSVAALVIAAIFVAIVLPLAWLFCRLTRTTIVERYLI